jgi:hypothetical protein
MTRNRERPLRVARRGAGYAAWGPGFYLWREDARELLRDAAALAGATGSDPDQGARRSRACSASRRRASIAAR